MLRRFLCSTRVRPEHRAADVVVNKLPNQYDAKHEERLRALASPDNMMSVESVEHEFRAEVAGALGRVERILTAKLAQLAVEDAALAIELSKPERNVSKLRILVSQWNLVQQQAMEARRDLMCQRQSAGFEILNHSALLLRYPIPLQKRLREDS